jgi:hypothetical protein
MRPRLGAFRFKSEYFNIYKNKEKNSTEQMTYRDIDIVGLLMEPLSE